MAGLTFTTDEYGALLDRLVAEFRFVGYDAPLSDGELALRHDVDLSVDRALAMANVEAERGISSTYCLLVAAPVYDPTDPATRRAIERIDALGHDVALHFDPHRYWPAADEPPADEIVERVLDERRSLARLFGLSEPVVSTHVPPEWLLDRAFDAFTSTYAPEFFSEVPYVSDSNQRWRDERPFPDGVPDRAQMLVHPGLWTAEGRRLDDLLAAAADRGHEAVETYVGGLGY